MRTLLLCCTHFLYLNFSIFVFFFPFLMSDFSVQKPPAYAGVVDKNFAINTLHLSSEHGKWHGYC